MNINGRKPLIMCQVIEKGFLFVVPMFLLTLSNVPFDGISSNGTNSKIKISLYDTPLKKKTLRRDTGIQSAE